MWRHSLQSTEINMGCCWWWWIRVTSRTLCWWAAIRATVAVVVAAAAASRYRTRWRCGLVTSRFPPACVESWSLTRGQFVVQTDGPSGQTTANQFLEHGPTRSRPDDIEAVARQADVTRAPSPRVTCAAWRPLVDRLLNIGQAGPLPVKGFAFLTRIW